jgi:hypothetical protein
VKIPIYYYHFIFYFEQRLHALLYFSLTYHDHLFGRDAITHPHRSHGMRWDDSYGSIKNVGV